jgi:hypothetical protein
MLMDFLSLPRAGIVLTPKIKYIFMRGRLKRGYVI